MRVLCVGDIHVKKWIIDRAMELSNNYDKVIFIGDYMDNWGASPSESIEILKYMKEVSLDPKVDCILGNHDYSYIEHSVSGQSGGWNPITYALVQSPDNKELRDWLHSLSVLLTVDGVLYSHAGVTDSWSGDTSPKSLWSNNSPIWVRPKEYGGKHTYKNVAQVFGHTPIEKITNFGNNHWGIDTFSQRSDGTYIGDKTFLEVIDGKEFNVVQSEVCDE